MGGNNRDFGSLEFRRLLKRFILSGGHKIPLLPGSPIELADVDVSLNKAKVFDEPTVFEPIGVTGKSSSEVLIYSSINPQYDNRLFHELRVQYKKITRSEHVKNMFFTQIVLNVPTCKQCCHIRNF